MKDVVMTGVGSILLIIVMICPFPAILEVSGIVWRVIAGLLSCCLLVIGICRCTKQKSRNP